MSSVNKILLWIRICNFISYTVMYSFVEFESLKKWLVLALLTCRFLTFASGKMRRIFQGYSSIREMRGRAVEQSLFLGQRCSLVCHCYFLTWRHLQSMKKFNKLFCQQMPWSFYAENLNDSGFELRTSDSLRDFKRP